MRTITVPGDAQPAIRSATLVSTNTVGGDFFARGWNPASSRPRIRCARFAARSASRRAERGGGAPLFRRRGRGRTERSSSAARPAHDRRSRQRHEVRLGARGESSHRVHPVGQDPGESRRRRTHDLCAHAGDASRFDGDLESAVRSLDKTIPLYNVKTLATQKAESLVRERLIAALSHVVGSRGLGVGGHRALWSHQLWRSEPDARDRHSRFARRGPSARRLADRARRDRHGRRRMCCRRRARTCCCRDSFSRSSTASVRPT